MINLDKGAQPESLRRKLILRELPVEIRRYVLEVEAENLLLKTAIEKHETDVLVARDYHGPADFRLWKVLEDLEK